MCNGKACDSEAYIPSDPRLVARIEKLTAKVDELERNTLAQFSQNMEIFKGMVERFTQIESGQQNPVPFPTIRLRKPGETHGS